MLELTDILENNLITQIGSTNIEKRLCGFDTNIGAIQYCAPNGDVHTIHSDGSYEVLTGQTTFLDGTALQSNRVAITPETTGGTFIYWYQGEKHEVNHAIVSSNEMNDGTFYLYLDSNETLSSSGDLEEVFVYNVPVAYFRTYSVLNNLYYFSDKRHTVRMQGTVKRFINDTKGVVRTSGIVPNGISIGTSKFNGVTNGEMLDCDITIDTPAQTLIPHLYIDSLEWKMSAPDDNIGLIIDGTCRYNENEMGEWTAATFSSSNFIIQTLWATDNKITPLVWMTGQKVYTSREDAWKQIISEGERFKNGETPMPGHGMTPVAAVILDGNGNVTDDSYHEIWVELKGGVPLSHYEEV